MTAPASACFTLLFLSVADRDAWLERLRARLVGTARPAAAPVGPITVWSPAREPEPGDPAMLYASEGAVRAAELAGLFATTIGLLALPAGAPGAFCPTAKTRRPPDRPRAPRHTMADPTQGGPFGPKFTRR